MAPPLENLSSRGVGPASPARRAKTPTEVTAILAECAGEFDLIEVALVPGQSHYPGPDARQISPVGERPYRVDYPIAWEEAGVVREVVLRLWCERPGDLHHVGAERIAARLGPALEQWFRSHPSAFAPNDVQHRATPKGFAKPE